MQAESRLQRKIQRAIKKEFGSSSWFFKTHGSAFQPAGIPDILGVIGGRFFAVEVKMPKTGKVSKIQQATIRRIKAAGGIALVATSTEEAIEGLILGLRKQ